MATNLGPNLAALLLDHPLDDDAALLHTADRSLRAGEARRDARAFAARLRAAGVVPGQAVTAYGATVAGPIVKCVIEAAIAIDAGQKPTGTYDTCPS